MHAKTPSWLIVAGACALLAGCASSGGAGSGATAKAPAASGSGKKLTLDVPVLATGKTFDMKQLEGKVVLVDFWASWCKPCRKSMPFYNQLYARYKARGFEMIGVNVDESKALADRFLSEVEVKFPVLWDKKQQLVAKLAVKKMPTAFLTDRSGAIRWSHASFVDSSPKEIEAEVKKLVDRAEFQRLGGK